MRRVLLSGLLLLLSFPLSLRAFEDKGRECFIFINSSIPEQLSLFNEFNHEFFLSRKLQGQVRSLLLILGRYRSPIVLLHRLLTIVRVFGSESSNPSHCLHCIQCLIKKRLRELYLPQEIRQCLQGK